MNDEPPLESAQWAQRYADAQSTFDGFRSEVERQLCALLERKAILVAKIESRTKNVESFAEKLERKAGKYKNPLEEMTDLAAVRVILYYPRDVAHIGTLIEQEFAVDWANSARRGEADPPDRFGYRSDHYIVRLRQTKASPLAWQHFAGLRAEVQVRTVMQHAWAAVDHRIRYKASDLPRDLSRRLFRLSALLELADEQFAALQVASDEQTASYAQAVEDGELSVQVDALSLTAYLDTTCVGEQWTSRAIKLGYRALEMNPDLDEDVERLLRVLQAAGAQTLADVAAILDIQAEDGETLLAEILGDAQAAAPGAFIWAFPGDVLSLLILGFRGTPRSIRMCGFRPALRAAILAARDRRK